MKLRKLQKHQNCKVCAKFKISKCPHGVGGRTHVNAIPCADKTSKYNTIQYNTIQYNTIQYNTIQYNTIQYNTIQYNTIQYNTIQYNTIQYNTIQYNTIQYNTIQYNTIQYNTYLAKLGIRDTLGNFNIGDVNIVGGPRGPGAEIGNVNIWGVRVGGFVTDIGYANILGLWKEGFWDRHWGCKYCRGPGVEIEDVNIVRRWGFGDIDWGNYFFKFY